MTQTTPDQARQLADECWTTGAQVEAEALRSLASQVERLEAERDSFKSTLEFIVDCYSYEASTGEQARAFYEAFSAARAAIKGAAL